uniref:LRRCT domain-containing protein n=1 Tax=Rhabditophanes sp. KR3021 TaxID=114890 RepID=A0AC35THA6_9BILA
MISLAYYLALFLLIIPIVNGQSFLCPNRCVCDDASGNVNCDNANLKFFPIQLSPMTKKLSLANNNIQKINPSDLDVYSQLEFLDLSNCNINQISFDKIQPLKHLKELRLASNNLANITDNSFRKLKHLEILDLSNNAIERLLPHSLKGLNKLLSLNLSSNSINFISNTFEDLKELITLDLSYNRLTSAVFSDLNQLNTLLLRHNLISEIPGAAFSSLHALVELDISQNVMTQIPDFHGLEQLKFLNLSTNSILSIPQRVWSKIEGVAELDLSFNAIAVLEPNSFHKLTNLRVLTLSYLPNLRQIKDKAFESLQALSNLQLHNNPLLSKIGENVFHDLVLLSQLSLHSNDLSILSEKQLKFNQLAHLELDNNPWNCTCEFLNIIKDNHDRLQLDKIYCVNPERLQNRQALALNGECSIFSELDGNQILIYSIIGLLIAFTLVIGIITFFKCKFGGRKESDRSTSSQNSSRAPLYQTREYFQGIPYTNEIICNGKLLPPKFASPYATTNIQDEGYYTQLSLDKNTYYAAPSTGAYSPPNHYAVLIDDRRPIITPPMVPAPPPRNSETMRHYPQAWNSHQSFSNFPHSEI